MIDLNNEGSASTSAWKIMILRYKLQTMTYQLSESDRNEIWRKISKYLDDLEGS